LRPRPRVLRLGRRAGRCREEHQRAARGVIQRDV
jgi:hypothetical protein